MLSLFRKKDITQINRLNLQDWIREKFDWTRDKAFFIQLNGQRIEVEIRPGEEEYYRKDDLIGTLVMDLETWSIKHNYQTGLCQQDYLTKQDKQKLFVKNWK